jgi:hypothetical protein
MNFMSLLGGGGMGGGGSGTAATSSARSAASAGGGTSSVGINSRDVVWIAVAFAGALALVGLLWLAFRK